jgi:hypothetical protein
MLRFARARRHLRAGTRGGFVAQALALAVALALPTVGGCKQSGLVGELTGGDAGPYDLDAFPGYIDGRIQAHAVFNHVSNVYWSGGDADPSHLAIFIFREPATCAEASMPGWQEVLRPNDFMMLTVAGTTTGSYDVSPDSPPAPGAARAVHEINQHTPIDSVALSGTVGITSIVPGEGLRGTVDVTFDTGTMAGVFNAIWCPTGVPPN